MIYSRARTVWCCPLSEEQREQMILTVEDAMRGDAALVLEQAEKVADAIKRLDGKEGFTVLFARAAGRMEFIERSELQRLAADTSQSHAVAEANSKGPLPFVFRDMSWKRRSIGLGIGLRFPC